MNNEVGAMDLLIVLFIAALTFVPLVMGFLDWLDRRR